MNASPTLQDFKRRPLAAACSLLLVLAAGCGGSHPDAAPAAATAAKKPAVAAAPAAPAPTSFPKSVFSVSGKPRDPFFPTSARFKVEQKQTAVAQAGGAPAEVSSGVLAAALQSGLQGIFGTTGNRIAVINNSMVELGRDTMLSVQLEGREQRFKVRGVQIMKNSVVLAVAGQPQHITLKLSATN